MGFDIIKPATLRILLGCTALMLAACDENGAFVGSNTAETTPSSRGVPTRIQTTEEDVERPDVFEVTDRGLWDGRPSLGGVWVAHPDVTDPERVIIRNTANGQSVIGALFRRERENPGPLLQLSSDAADELGILPGAPTEVNVVALRRREIEVPVEPLSEDPADNPVIADLAAPITVEATPLDPIAGAAAAITAAEAAAPAIDVTLPDAEPIIDATLPAADAAAATVTAVAPVAAVAPPTGKLVQIGVFSVEANANGAADRLRAAGLAGTVVAQETGGRTVWRVVAGPAEDDAARLAMIEQVKELGFVDAVATDG